MMWHRNGAATPKLSVEIMSTITPISSQYDESIRMQDIHEERVSSHDMARMYDCVFAVRAFWMQGVGMDVGRSQGVENERTGSKTQINKGIRGWGGVIEPYDMTRYDARKREEGATWELVNRPLFSVCSCSLTSLCCIQLRYN